MFSISANSLCFDVDLPHIGEAHQGVSPKGAADKLSFLTAHVLLGEPEHFKALEIIFSRYIRFDEELLFTLVGASPSCLYIRQNERKVPLVCATVYKAHKGDTLHIGNYTKGARLYLMSTPLTEHNKEREGLSRGAFTRWFEKPAARMRFFKGIEYHYLQSDFFQQRWRISSDSDRMGLRLLGKMLQSSSYDIVSSAVTEGTVQLSQHGPILLMSHHQTTGGYPRILQLSSADIHTLAQYPVGSCFEAEMISIEESKALLQRYMHTLKNFRNNFI